MKRSTFFLVMVASCERKLDETQACEEARWAIAARVWECTGDEESAEAVLDEFDAQYTCREWDMSDGEVSTSLGPSDTEVTTATSSLFHCSLAIRSLACETVESYGTDVAAFMGSSDGCSWVVEEKGGAR
jgi:hypothetical protein